MYRTCENIRHEGVRAYECGNPLHGCDVVCRRCAAGREDTTKPSIYARTDWDKYTSAAKLAGVLGVTTETSVVHAVRVALDEVLPRGVDCEVRAVTSGRVDPGVVRVTVETHDGTKAERLQRARLRMRAYHWGAFVLGIALGTPVGLLLEALRQGWTP